MTQQCCQTGWDSSIPIPALQVSDIKVKILIIEVCRVLEAKSHRFITPETNRNALII